MPRKRKTSPAEDIVDLVALLPWWAGLFMAVVTYIALHALASLPATAAPVSNPGQLGGMVVEVMLRTVAYYAQFLVPLLCLAGAGISAWKRRQRQTLTLQVTDNPIVSTLERMSWQEFEMLVGESFRLQGYQVSETGQGGADGGIDLVLRKGDETYLVQCKQWKAYRVGVEVVRELYGAMAAKGASGGFVVTSGRFTEPARQFAQGRNLHLIDGKELLRLFEQVKSASTRPTNNVRTSNIPNAVPKDEAGCPRCGKPMVRRIARQGRNAGAPFWGCSGFPQCSGTRQIGDLPRRPADVSR